MKARRIVSMLVGIVLTAAAARPAEAAPVRSGTILGGWFPFAVVLAPGGTPECSWNVDCLAWMASGCEPALAGRDPGVFASIVDVRDIAGSRKRRSLTIVPKGAEIMWGGVGVEFWTRACTEIDLDPWIPPGFTYTASFRIPKAAAWMTVSSVDDTTFSWELR
jgi:hypothetical protein